MRTGWCSGRGSQRGHHQRTEKQSSGVLREGGTLGPGVGAKVAAYGAVSAIDERYNNVIVYIWYMTLYIIHKLYMYLQ